MSHLIHLEKGGGNRDGKGGMIASNARFGREPRCSERPVMWVQRGYLVVMAWLFQDPPSTARSLIGDIFIRSSSKSQFDPLSCPCPMMMREHMTPKSV